MQTLKKLLKEADVIQKGQFTLKSGEISPVYIDLRRAISYPQLLRAMGQAMWEVVIRTTPADTLQLLCGVPYGALPLTTCIALDQNLPMVLSRKSPKQHGTQNSVEGVYQPGQACLVVEDVMTTGKSILNTIANLQAAGLTVKDVVVFADREQEGITLLNQQGYRLHRVFRLAELLS